MSDEIFETEVIEPVEAVVESPETETESHEEEVKQEYKPWKEKSKPESIPYDRFSEVNRERRELERILSERESELARYKESENKVKEVKSISDIKLENFESFDEYQKARDAILVKEIETTFHRQSQEREDARRVAEAEANLMKTFENRIAEAAKSNPEVTDAVNHISQFANHIQASVRYALLTDDNAGEVAYEIATTPGMLEFLIKSNPVDAQRKIDKISAKYDLKKESRSSESIPTSMPSIPSQIKTPKSTNGSASGGKFLTGNETIAEYRRKRALGYQ